MNMRMTATEIRKSQRAMYAKIERFQKLFWDEHRKSVKRWIDDWMKGNHFKVDRN